MDGDMMREAIKPPGWGGDCSPVPQESSIWPGLLQPPLPGKEAGKGVTAPRVSSVLGEGGWCWVCSSAALFSESFCHLCLKGGSNAL